MASSNTSVAVKQSRLESLKSHSSLGDRFAIFSQSVFAGFLFCSSTLSHKFRSHVRPTHRFLPNQFSSPCDYAQSGTVFFTHRKCFTLNFNGSVLERWRFLLFGFIKIFIDLSGATLEFMRILILKINADQNLMTEDNNGFPVLRNQIVCDCDWFVVFLLETE